MLGFLAVACDDGGEGADDAPSVAPWSVVSDAYQPGALLSVWSGSPDDVWIVGGELGRAAVLHFDGAAWTEEDPGVAQKLWWVHGFRGGPVFAVGEGGAIVRRASGAWEVMDVGLPGVSFYGVWGAAANDVWAVGGPFNEAPPEAAREAFVVMHFDGARWTRVRVADLEGLPASAQKTLFKVWGADADHVFAVGDGGVVVHYDGSAWKRVESSVRGNTLFTVSGRAADDVWAVGGLALSELIHWDGEAWSQVDLPRTAPGIIQGLWTAPGQPVFVAGHEGWTAWLHDDEWTEGEAATSHALHAIWGDGAGALWAAGGNIQSFLPDHVGAVLVSGREAPALP